MEIHQLFFLCPFFFDFRPGTIDEVIGCLKQFFSYWVKQLPTPHHGTDADIWDDLRAPLACASCFRRRWVVPHRDY